MIRRVFRAKESLAAATNSPCCVAVWYSSWIRSESYPWVLFMTAPLSGRLIVCSFYRWIVAAASYIQNWLFVSRGCGYVWANYSTGLPYDKFIITIVERNTWVTALIHCLRYCYSCFTLVTMLGNELMIFPGIAFYYHWPTVQYCISYSWKYKLGG